MADQVASLLWYTDRTRYVDGQGWCKRARALGYHLGPDGYGIQKKGTRLPLMTGIAAHDGLAPVLEWAKVYDTPEKVTNSLTHTGYLVPNHVVRQAIAAAQQAYWKTVEARGFAYLDNEPGVKEITTEQNYLIEGLIWCWVLEVLPEVLQRGQILEVETEGLHVVGCTCGLGDGVLGEAEHVARGCQGIGYQQRPDFILRTWSTKELEYHEFKTTGSDAPSFRDKWEVAPQTFSAMMDVERRYEAHVQSFYIHGLIKGKREGEYNPETRKRDGTIRQQSVFCYAYRKPANPPMEPEDWRPSYEYFDSYEGKNKRLGKAYQRAPIWELPESVISPETPTRGEWWVKAIPSEIRRKQLVLIGPLSRQTQMVEGFFEELVAEEQRWQQALWALYDVYTQVAQKIAAMDWHNPLAPEAVPWQWVWVHPDYQAALNQLFPRSYECRRFGLRHACQYETICFYREGWADPMGSGHYIPRRPHHAPELLQAQARGLILPDVGVAEGEEE